MEHAHRLQALAVQDKIDEVNASREQSCEQSKHDGGDFLELQFQLEDADITASKQVDVVTAFGLPVFEQFIDDMLESAAANEARHFLESHEMLEAMRKDHKRHAETLPKAQQRFLAQSEPLGPALATKPRGQTKKFAAKVILTSDAD